MSLSRKYPIFSKQMCGANGPVLGEIRVACLYIEANTPLGALVGPFHIAEVLGNAAL